MGKIDLFAKGLGAAQSAMRVGQVFVVDDDDDFRSSLVNLLRTRTEWAVRGVESAASWLDCEDAEAPGCVLLDQSMPDIPGFEVLEAMRQRRSRHQVIMITGTGDIKTAVEAMRLGAVDFLEKPVLFEQLQGSIAKAFERLENENAARDRVMAAKARLGRLRPRELAVLIEIVGGLPNKLIAHKLGLSVRTVELYRAALMDKLDVSSVAELVKLSFAAELMDPW